MSRTAGNAPGLGLPVETRCVLFRHIGPGGRTSAARRERPVEAGYPRSRVARVGDEYVRIRDKIASDLPASAAVPHGLRARSHYPAERGPGLGAGIWRRRTGECGKRNRRGAGSLPRNPAETLPGESHRLALLPPKRLLRKGRAIGSSNSREPIAAAGGVTPAAACVGGYSCHSCAIGNAHQIAMIGCRNGPGGRDRELGVVTIGGCGIGTRLNLSPKFRVIARRRSAGRARTGRRPGRSG